MSDLDLEFQDLHAIAIHDGIHAKFFAKLEQITKDFRFADSEDCHKLFNYWLYNRSVA